MKNRLFVSIFLIVAAAPVYADHAWSNYHWARTTASFDLIVVNSTTSDWDAYVEQAVSDWSAASALNLVQELNGSTANRVRRQCSAPDGRVRICNLAYGNNGWLGIAGIYIDADGHITKGYTKLNDTYFSSSYYNTPEWKQSVACQELGHDIGLSHQDENFNNTSLYSCMDYQDPPYPYPNPHDYDQLSLIYGHADSYDSYDSGASGGGGGDGGTCNAPPGRGCNKSDLPGEAAWGLSLGRRGQSETFMRIEPDGTRILVFVTWAEGN